MYIVVIKFSINALESSIRKLCNVKVFVHVHVYAQDIIVNNYKNKKGSLKLTEFRSLTNLCHVHQWVKSS